MLTIYKYPFPIRNGNSIDMPEGARILALQTQDGVPCFWSLVDTNNELVPRWFVTFGTGHSIPERFHGEYRGTYQLMSGSLVFHVFETEGPLL